MNQKVDHPYTSCFKEGRHLVVAVDWQANRSCIRTTSMMVLGLDSGRWVSGQVSGEWQMISLNTEMPNSPTGCPW
jgi:hypothetical protein